MADTDRTARRFAAPRSRLGGPALRALAPIVLGLVVLLAWQLTVLSGRVLPTLLPGPGAVFSRFLDELGTGQLFALTGVTLLEALLGSVLAAAIALPLGYLIAHVRVFDAAVSPYLAASQAIPAVAVAPLLVIWVGYGLLPIVLLCALLVFFPVVLSTVLGIRGVRRELIEAAELDGAGGLRMLHHIEAPLARRAVLTGIRNGFTLSITGAVVGELVMGGNGLGMLLSVQASTADTTGLFATLVMLCLLAVGIYLVLVAIEWGADPLRSPRTTTRSKESA